MDGGRGQGEGAASGWFESRAMFKRAPTAPTTVSKPPAVAGPLRVKEAKWGGYNERLLSELAVLQTVGWVVRSSA